VRCIHLVNVERRLFLTTASGFSSEEITPPNRRLRHLFFETHLNIAGGLKERYFMAAYRPQ